MPTEFSKCIDCHWNTQLPITHLFNKGQKEEYEKLEVLKEIFPTEIAVKILKMSYIYFNCCYCKSFVCKEHSKLEYEQYGILPPVPIVLCGNCVKIYIGYI